MTNPIFRPTPGKIPADWTPEQAMTVCEFLSDLCDQIWTHYHLDRFELFDDPPQAPTPPNFDIDPDEIPY